MTEEAAFAVIEGVDYSTSRPNLGQLAAAGKKFVMRYVSPGPNPKNLGAAELKAIRAAGLMVGVFFESYAGRMRGGWIDGAFDARTADAELQALGLHGLPVFFSADWDVQPGELPLTDAYLDGAASVIGRARTSGYGGHRFIQHSFDHHKITFGCQTYAWSRDAAGHLVWDPRAQLRQYDNGVPLAGGEVDLENAHARDFGQWPRPLPPGPYRHVVPPGDTLTLDALAKSRGTTRQHITEVSVAHLDPLHLAVFNAYLALCVALAAAGLPMPAMPEGMAYFTTHP